MKRLLRRLMGKPSPAEEAMAILQPYIEEFNGALNRRLKPFDDMSDQFEIDLLSELEVLQEDGALDWNEIQEAMIGVIALYNEIEDEAIAAVHRDMQPYYDIMAEFDFGAEARASVDRRMGEFRFMLGAGLLNTASAFARQVGVFPEQ